MKDCWKILGISKTSDHLAIRKAYRERIKRWHPDTVPTPELVRHYTIKCAELNEAYHQARDYCSGGTETAPQQEELIRRRPSTTPTAVRRQEASSKTTSGRSIWITIRHLVSVAASLIIVFGVIIALFNTTAIVNWALSLPLGDRLRVTTFASIAVAVALLFGWVVFAFEMLVLIFWVTLPLADTKFSKYSLKVGWSLATFGNYFLYFGRSGWPFAHKTSGYFEVIYELCKVLAWAIGPIVTAGFWLKEYLKYPKAKAVVDNRLASISEET